MGASPSDDPMIDIGGRLRTLAELPRLAPLDVGEPTKAVLLETPAQFRAVRVHIVEPADRG